MSLRLLAIILLVILIDHDSWASETGVLAGLVTDRDSGEELIAVDIVLIGTGVVTQTDLDGRYRVENLTAGTYNVRISYLGYNTKVIEDVEVEAGQARRLDVALESFRANAIDDVMVTATRILSTEGAILADRKRASVVGDAISAAQISRSPDGQAGDALKRVTGLLVVDGGYVNVRGMPDRYNVTLVDGAVATAVDPDLDRKSFNFEVVPTNLVSSLQVIKTALPDMPGDFTGGLVRVNTIEFPEQATTQFSVQTGMDSGSAGEVFYRDAYSGGTDWLGRDDGGRDRPQILVDAGRFPLDTTPYPDDVGRALTNRWSAEETTSPLPRSFAVSHGNRFLPFGRKLGVVGALSYKNSSSINHEYKSYDPSDNWFDATDYLTEINIGALLNVNLELASRQVLSFRNLYGRNTEDSYLAARKFGNELSYRQVMEWEEKDQLASSLAGSHALPVGNLDFKWQLLYNENRGKEPDLRYLDYRLSPEPITMFQNRRNWLYMKEFRNGADTSLEWSLGDVDRPARLAVGAASSTRRRVLDNSPFTIRNEGPAGGIEFLPPETIFAPENFKEGLFTLRYQDQFEGSYNGVQNMNAYYAMLDVPFNLGQESFRLAGGARLEDNQIDVSAYDKMFNDRIPSGYQTSNVLPSVNLTFEYDEKTNVRLAFYRSVNYPEMREIAPVKSIDFKNDWEVVGNADLRYARLSNYDLRLERFPRYGEVLALSFFYKGYTDAIEQNIMPQATLLDLVSWVNGSGKNYGFEVELRSRLDVVSRSLYDFTLSGNYTRVWSEVDYQFLASGSEDVSARLVNAIRPLQGQAPWVVNLNLKWEDEDRGFSATMLYHRVGRRLLSVSVFPERNIYEEPRHLLDMTLTQRLSGSTSFKVSAKNILSASRRRIFDVDQGAGDRLPQVLPYGERDDSASFSASIAVKF